MSERPAVHLQHPIPPRACVHTDKPDLPALHWKNGGRPVPIAGCAGSLPGFRGIHLASQD